MWYGGGGTREEKGSWSCPEIVDRALKIERLSPTRHAHPPPPFQARYTISLPHYIALPGLTRVFCIALFARGAAGLATTLPFELSMRLGGILRAPDRATLLDCRVG